MKMRTLRGRLLLSSVLWTVGLLFVSSVPFTLLMEHQSRLHVAMHVHRFVQNPVVIMIAVFCMLAGLVVANGGLASVDKLLPGSEGCAPAASAGWTARIPLRSSRSWTI